MTAHILTFGIELEFICLRPKTDFDTNPYESEDNGIGPLIYRTLINQGIPATGWEDDDSIDIQWSSHSRWRVETDELTLSKKEQERLPDDWTSEAVELSSRKMHFFSDNWRSEVAAVLRVLRQVESSGCRFITNKSTGFHVHVGNNSQRIGLPVAKNVFQLVTAFERLFDELHTVPRIAIPVPRPHAHCYYPPSFFHTYGQAYDEQKDTRSSPMFDRLANVKAVRSYQELGALFRVSRLEHGKHCPTTGHNSSYNFDNLFADPEYDRHEETLIGTIEFRQHTGTLDLVEIIAWASLVCELVMFSSEVPPTHLLNLVVRGIDINFRLQDLLTAIGCSPDVMEHYLNGTIVGVLSEEASHLSGCTTNTPVDLLIAQNDDECEERCDRALVQAAIDHKYRSGLYGIEHRLTNVVIPQSLVAAELERAMRTVRMSGHNVNTEAGLSLAILRVLRLLSQSYSRSQNNVH